MVFTGAKLVEASLILAGSDQPIKIYSFDFGFTQYTDETGKPTGYPTGGTINFMIETTPDTVLIDWMLDAKALKNGKIEIGNKDKVIEFKNAACIQYHESFNHMGGAQPMTTSFTISAEEIKVGGAPPFQQKRKTV
ncbi:MAG: type VI secretion system tube protein TssD [Bacteroidales bacterium]|jgi:hypothetical protein